VIGVRVGGAVESAIHELMRSGSGDQEKRKDQRDQRSLAQKAARPSFIPSFRRPDPHRHRDDAERKRQQPIADCMPQTAGPGFSIDQAGGVQPVQPSNDAQAQQGCHTKMAWAGAVSCLHPEGSADQV
jgi:hypothetical protein